MSPNIFGSFLENADLFVEIGAASSISTRLIRQCVPERWEAGIWFRRLLHFLPVFSAAFLLLSIWAFPNGGIVVLHAVAIGGMSGNLRDIFKASIDRIKPDKTFEVKTTTARVEQGEEGAKASVQTKVVKTTVRTPPAVGAVGSSPADSSFNVKEEIPAEESPTPQELQQEDLEKRGLE